VAAEDGLLVTERVSGMCLGGSPVVGKNSRGGQNCVMDWVELATVVIVVGSTRRYWG